MLATILATVVTIWLTRRKRPVRESGERAIIDALKEDVQSLLYKTAETTAESACATFPSAQVDLLAER